MQNRIRSSQELSISASKCIIELAHKYKTSHIGGALSVIDIISVLYSDILRFKIEDPSWENRDRVFYSKGHACTALYAILQEVGFYDTSSLWSFTQNGSFFTSHVNHKVPGVELSTGSLGHALSVACGVALAGKIKNAEWNVFAILSDGELDEGSNWEAILFAPHHLLNNLTVIIDYNKIQSFGLVKQVLDLEPLRNKLETFGWNTFEVDGHDHNAISNLLLETRQFSLKPIMIIAHTIKGKGVPFMENELAWHYKSPDEEQLQIALSYLENKFK